MSSVLPWFFITAATVLLACALLAFWQSLRSAFGLADLAEVESEGDEDERRSLLLEKEALLANLRDLAFDHEAGKLSDDDFRELDAKLRAKARDVLRRLDADVAGQRAKAEALVAARFAQEGLAYEGGAAEVAAEDVPSGDAQPSAGPVACSKCATRNDDDAAFCKKCGAKLAREGAEA